MTPRWAREVIVQVGSCLRFTCMTRFGPIRVEQHSTKCQKESKSPRGWVLTAHEVGIRDVRLDASTEEEACSQAPRAVATVLREAANELDPPG